jgi:carbonic anhydrase/acetyltransferase-like protein (isoleucine patch superfamily)
MTADTLNAELRNFMWPIEDIRKWTATEFDELGNKKGICYVKESYEITIFVTAIIESDSRIGPGARIGNNVIIESGVRIGLGAIIEPDSRIWAGAIIEPGSRIGRGAIIETGARIGPDSRIGPGSIIGQGAIIETGAIIELGARIGYDARIGPGARIGSDARIGHGASIMDGDKYLSINPIGSRNSLLTVVKKPTGIMVYSGCFSGTCEEFLAKVTTTHGNNQHAKAYRAAMMMCALLWDAPITNALAA